MFGTCCENGQSLAEHCEDPDSRGDLETKLGQLQSDWEKLGQRFGEVLQKLSDALVQVGGVTVSIVTSVVLCKVDQLHSAITSRKYTFEQVPSPLFTSNFLDKYFSFV